MIFFVAIGAALFLASCARSDDKPEKSSSSTAQTTNTSSLSQTEEPPEKPEDKIASSVFIPNSDIDWMAKYGFYHVDVDPGLPGVQTRVGTEETAIKEFKELPIDSKARLFRRLVESEKRGGRTAEFLRNAIGYSLQGVGLERIRETLFSAKVICEAENSERTFWARRLLLDKDLFKLEQDYNHYASEIQKDPGHLLKLRQEIEKALVSAYSASAVNGRSPLFDTDGDGYYDYSLYSGGHQVFHDEYPLDPLLQKDLDEDETPDMWDPEFWDFRHEIPFSAFGKVNIAGQWRYAKKEEEGWKVNYNKIFYTVHPVSSNRGIEIKITLPIYLHPDTKSVIPLLEKKKPVWKKQLEEYFNDQFNKNVEGWNMTFEVNFLPKPSKEYRSVTVYQGEINVQKAGCWSVDIDSNSLAHEVANLLGLPDRYHDPKNPLVDQTFKPGYQFLVPKKDLMGPCKKDCEFSFQDILSIIYRSTVATQVREAGLRYFWRDNLDGALKNFVESWRDEPNSIAPLYIRKIREIKELRSQIATP